MKTAMIALRVTPEFKAQLEALAKADRRTMSSLIHIVLADYAAERSKSKRKSA